MKYKLISSILIIVMLITLFQPIILAADTTTKTYQDYEYTINDNNEITITKYKGEDSELTIPDAIKENPVCYIGAEAFKGKKSITCLTIPDTVKKINAKAFQECTNITSVIFEDGLITIDRFAFDGCSSIKNIELPNTVTAISEYAFRNCSNLKDLKLSNKLELIGPNVFENCISLTSIAIPKTLTRTGGSNYNEHSGPFSKCSNLKNVTFEEGITVIANHLFANCNGIEEITIPNTVTTIKEYAFKNCANLKNVSIPNSITTIQKNAFENCPQLTLSFGIESCALEYAILNNIKTNINNIEDYEPYALNKKSSYYTTNSNNTTITNGNNYIIKYEIKDKFKDQIDNLSVNLLCPNGLYINENTIRNNKKVCSGFKYENNLLTIPVSDFSGTITFTAEFTDLDQICSLAYISYKENGIMKKDYVGLYFYDGSNLSIKADEIITTDEVLIYGATTPLTDVELSIDGKVAQTITSSKAGIYSTTLKIDNPKELKTYDISATIKVNDKKISRNVKVKYDTGSVQVNEFLLEYEDHTSNFTYDLLNTNSLAKTVVFYPNAGYSFKVKLNNANKAKHVYVESTRGGISKTIEAFYDKTTGYFVTKEKFDGDNNNYVPGQLSVQIEENFDEYLNDIDKATEYLLNEASSNIDLESKEKEIIDACDGTEDGNWDYIYHFSEDFKIEFISKEYTEEEFYNRLVEVGLLENKNISFDSNNGTKKLRTASTDNTNQYIGALDTSINQELESTDYVDTKDGFKSLVNFADDYISIFSWDFEIGKFVEKIVKTYVKGKLEYPVEFLYNAGRNGDGFLNADELSELYGTGYSKGFNVAWSSGKQVFSYFKNDYELNRRYEEATTDEERREIRDLLDRQYFVLLMRLICIHADYIADGSGLAGIPLKVALFLLEDELDAYETGNTDNMIFVKVTIALLKSPVGKYFTWIVDPSGYVYDAETKERLENVKCTIYYKENEDAKSLEWNANEYNQENPIYTDLYGSYAWDVPEGLWQVKYEKEGYETTYSEWLEVPPPQTDVNIAMTKKDENNASNDNQENTNTNSNSSQNTNQNTNANTNTNVNTNITGNPNVNSTKKEISKFSISGISNKTYTGKSIKQSVVVKDGNVTLKNGTDYTVSYKNNKKVGTATVVITGKGNYTGTVTKTFKINPKGTSLKKLTKGKKQFKATWKAQKTQTTGYQIQYSTNKNFKSGNKTVKIKKNKTTSSTVKKLKAKKKYYVRIRTYKTVNGKTYYSGWSKVKNVTTKK